MKSFEDQPWQVGLLLCHKVKGQRHQVDQGSCCLITVAGSGSQVRLATPNTGLFTSTSPTRPPLSPQPRPPFLLPVSIRRYRKQYFRRTSGTGGGNSRTRRRAGGGSTCGVVGGRRGWNDVEVEARRRLRQTWKWSWNERSGAIKGNHHRTLQAPGRSWPRGDHMCRPPYRPPSCVAMGWAMSRGPSSAGPQSSRQKCVHVGETFNRFADSGL